MLWVLNENVKLLQISANKKNIEIVIKIPEMELVFADINMINTVVRNILTNAIKFTEEKGKVIGLVGIGRDITKQKQTEEQLKRQSDELQEMNVLLEERSEEILQQSEELKNQRDILDQKHSELRTLIDTIPDFIYFKDTQARFITANEKLVKVMKTGTLEKLIGKTDFDFYPPELAQKFYDDDIEVIKQGKPIINKEEKGLDEMGNPRMDPESAEKLIMRLCAKIHRARTHVNDWETYGLEDARLVVLAYGVNARGVREAAERMRAEGHKIGMVRLKSLWPFPDELMDQLGHRVQKVVVSELNNGMLIREVERFRHRFSVAGITVPTPVPLRPSEIYHRLLEEI